MTRVCVYFCVWTVAGLEGGATGASPPKKKKNDRLCFCVPFSITMLKNKAQYQRASKTPRASVTGPLDPCRISKIGTWRFAFVMCVREYYLLCPLNKNPGSAPDECGRILEVTFFFTWGYTFVLLLFLVMLWNIFNFFGEKKAKFADELLMDGLRTGEKTFYLKKGERKNQRKSTQDKKALVYLVSCLWFQIHFHFWEFMFITFSGVRYSL